MKPLVIQSINALPIDLSINREVAAMYYSMNAIIESIELHCKVLYKKDGIDITNMYNPKTFILKATNEKKIPVLVDGNPVFETYQEHEQNELGEYQFNADGTKKMIDKQRQKVIGLYDYLYLRASQPAVLFNEFKAHILINAEQNFFEDFN